MKPVTTVMLDRGVGIMLGEIGLDSRSVLRRARLPADLLAHESTRVSVGDYFALIEAVEAEADDPALALRMASVSSPELFSPPVFAALCSANLAAAVARLATHKRLVAPVRLLHKESRQGLEVSWRWDDSTLKPPRLLATFELVFLVQLARIATRHRVVPLRVVCPHGLNPTSGFGDFFGVQPGVGPRPTLLFSAEDATRRFVTASESLWRSFQPELQRLRLDAEAHGSLVDQARAAILECLPGGAVSIDDAAQRMRVSRRTLQRRLSEEGVTYRELVRDVRAALASHYVKNTALPYGEVSFLLGFEETSSFFRAFREWTGATPEATRVESAARRAG